MFFQLAMSGQNGVMLAYSSEDDDHQADAEEILANSITFFKGLLEDPNIWTSDMIGFEEGPSTTGLDMEDFMAKSIFT